MGDSFVKIDSENQAAGKTPTAPILQEEDGASASARVRPLTRSQARQQPQTSTGAREKTAGKVTKGSKSSSAASTPEPPVIWKQYVEGVVNLQKEVDQLQQRLLSQDQSYQAKLRELEVRLSENRESRSLEEQTKTFKEQQSRIQELEGRLAHALQVSKFQEHLTEYNQQQVSNSSELEQIQKQVADQRSHQEVLYSLISAIQNRMSHSGGSGDSSSGSGDSSSSGSGGPAHTTMNFSHTTLSTALENILTPKIFHGNSDEDSVAWLEQLAKFAQFKGLTKEQTAALFPFLLDGAAKIWYMTLDTNIQKSSDLLNDRFKTHFQPTQSAVWRLHNDISARSQRPLERVSDYIAAVRQMATRAKLNEESTMSYLIKGLKPEIRTEVIKKSPTNILELTTAAQLAEDAIEIGGGSAMMAAIEEIKNQLVKCNTVSNVDGSASGSTRAERSPSRERRVRFDDDHGAGDHTSRRQSFGRGRGGGRGRGRGHGGGQPDAWARRPEEDGWRQPGRGHGNGPAAAWQTTTENNTGSWSSPPSGELCSRCNRRHPPRQCPAYQQICYSCSTRGHFARCCRRRTSGGGRQTPPPQVPPMQH